MNILLVGLIITTPGLRTGESPKCEVPAEVTAQVRSDVQQQLVPPSQVAAAIKDREFTYFIQHPEELAKHPECSAAAGKMPGAR